MRRSFGWMMIAAGALAACGVPNPALSAATGEAVVAAPKPVYVIRHLQKQGGDDPALTVEGATNAERLAALLADKGIVAIFATPTRRTMQTAGPLAKRLRITITPYDPRDPASLVLAVAAAPGPVLVVGHSNTVPDLVARFGGTRPAPMSEEDFGTLFLVEPDGTVAATQVR